MKRTLLSAAIAVGLAAFGGQASAQAISTATMAGLAAANQLFISGATAPQQTLIDTIETNICSGTFTRIRSTAGNSARYQGWGCTSGGQQVAIYYSTLGSNWGVQPVLFAGAGRGTPRMNPAACVSAAGVNRDDCGVAAITPVVPDVGVSDVRPTGFVGPNVPTSAQLVIEFPELTSGGAPTAAYAPVFAAISTPFSGAATVDPVQGVVFGIAVNNVLGALLQPAQGLPVVPNVRDNRAPALPKALVSSILRGSFGADDIDTALGISTAGLPGPTRYVVCRRVATSGTQTWANIYWLSNGALPDATLTGAPGANTTNWGGAEVAQVANVTGGNVRACMNRATSSGVPAIGIISAENDNNAGASPGGVANTWSFAKLDGVAMEDSTNGTQLNNLSNAKDGTYDYVGEVTLNRRGALAGTKNTVYGVLRTNLRGAAVCNIGANIATGAVQMAGVAGGGTCVTNWSREADPFTTPKRITP
jgi:hypothetical protein